MVLRITPSVLSYILRGAISLAMLCTFWKASFYMHYLENDLYASGMGHWYAVPFASHFIFGIIFLAAAPIFVSGFSRLRKIGILFFAILSSLTLLELLGVSTTATLHFFHNRISWVFYLILANSLLMIPLLLIDWSKLALQSSFLRLPIIILLLGIPFITYPLYPSDFEWSPQPVQDEKVIEFLNSQHQKSGATFIAFFSPSCGYCQFGVQRLHLMKDQLPPTLAILPGDTGNINYFFGLTKTSFPATNVENTRAFFDLTGPSVPKYYLKKGDNYLGFNAARLNYCALEEIKNGNSSRN